MHITVDRQRCCGYTLCAAEAPDIYSIDDEGYAVAPSSVPAELSDRARRGADACPDRAITIIVPQPAGADQRS
ncbi:ferredoxin [Mycolicibacterium sphagni]|nr:ferredoxin [Mycolicibacterium sphagni]